jgi:GNAT superfamily N-acetyltransferase
LARLGVVGGATVTGMPDVTIHRLDQRPDLIDRVYEVDFSWPEFMAKDPVANALYWQVARTFPELCAVATDPGGAVVATARALAFALDLPDRGDLPDGGLDRVTIWAFNDRLSGTAPDTASAVEIVVSAAYQGRGLSRRMLTALRDAARDAGLARLVAPVRPNGKHRYPDLPMAEYLTMTREDGLPADPWLRVHVRLGGRILRPAPTSMVMVGSLAQWRAWTGLPFDRSGDVIVPGALVPVHCDTEHDHAVYVEPNVWVDHDLTAAGTS